MTGDDETRRGEHPHKGDRARLCALIPRLSEDDVALLLKIAERMLARPDAQPALRAPAPRSAPAASARSPQVAAPALPDATPPAPAERRTYTLPETAQLLGISERFLRELVYQDLVPVLRLGRRVLVRNTTVQELLADPQRPSKNVS